MQPLRTQENRLALDLQDSIQQQIFALAMQVGVLKLLLTRDLDAAMRNVHKIEHLMHLVQLDLNSLQLLLSQEQGIRHDGER